MTKPTAEMNRSTVHALSPMQSCRDRGRQSFIFHTKRQLGQFARSTLQAEFGKAQATDDAESPAASVVPLDKHPAFAVWSALNIGSQQQMWRALGDMVSRPSATLWTRPPRNGIRPQQKGPLSWILSWPCRLTSPTPRITVSPVATVSNRDSDDWYAGALQEAGGTLYSRGAGTGAKDSKGQAVLRFIETMIFRVLSSAGHRSGLRLRRTDRQLCGRISRRRDSWGGLGRGALALCPSPCRGAGPAHSFQAGLRECHRLPRCFLRFGGEQYSAP